MIFFVVAVCGYYGENNNSTEFLTESEPEQAIVHARAATCALLKRAP
ncbi:hypothetical protein C357_14007 [Citreicella sp. 357]|nr:hypothetical protein [Salipiger aestuarii]EIE50493.1 hypothetical protein C357_14007 [Citreicella sp. 357]